MIVFFRSLSLAILLAGLLNNDGAALAQAAQQPPALAIGVVDMDRVSDESNPYKQANQELSAMQQTLAQNLEEVAQYTYLNTQETAELIAILGAKELTPAQKQRLAELKKVADERQGEYNQLAQVKDPTGEQKKRLQELTSMSNGRSSTLTDLQQKYQQTFRQRIAEIDASLGKAVGEIIQEIAKQQKLTIVLAKSVLISLDRKQDLVYFGGTDITDEVIKRLNQRK